MSLILERFPLYSYIVTDHACITCAVNLKHKLLVHLLAFCVVDTIEEGNCTTGAVRLNGSTPLEGRVEICINNAWGTVCRNHFSPSDTPVICRDLGYDFIDSYVIPLSDTAGLNVPIFLDELNCAGTEERVLNCQYSIGVHSCTHEQDAAVRCVGKSVHAHIIKHSYYCS